MSYNNKHNKTDTTIHLKSSSILKIIFLIPFVYSLITTFLIFKTMGVISDYIFIFIIIEMLLLGMVGTSVSTRLTGESFTDEVGDMGNNKA